MWINEKKDNTIIQIHEATNFFNLKILVSSFKFISRYSFLFFPILSTSVSDYFWETNPSVFLIKVELDTITKCLRAAATQSLMTFLFLPSNNSRCCGSNFWPVANLFLKSFWVISIGVMLMLLRYLLIFFYLSVIRRRNSQSV